MFGCGGLILRHTEKTDPSPLPGAGGVLPCGPGSSLAYEARLEVEQGDAAS